MYLVDFQTYILDEQQKDKKQNCTTMPPSHYVIDSFLFYLFSLKKHFHLFFALIFSSRSPLFFNHKKTTKKQNINKHGGLFGCGPQSASR